MKLLRGGSIRGVALCGLLVVASTVRGQAPDSAPKPDQTLPQLQARMRGGMYLLRGFPDVARVIWTQSAPDSWTLAPVDIHALSGIKIDSLRMHKTTLEIRGEHLILLRNASAALGWFPVGEDIKVEVETGDPGTPLALAVAAPFFSRIADGLSSLPAPYKNLPLPPNSSGSIASSKEGAACIPPRVLHMEEPNFSNEALTTPFFQGTSSVGMEIDAEGHTSNFWLRRPAGLGLDAMAVDAARKSTFHPAICAGKPAAVSMDIEFTFQKR